MSVLPVAWLTHFDFLSSVLSDLTSSSSCSGVFLSSASLASCCTCSTGICSNSREEYRDGDQVLCDAS